MPRTTGQKQRAEASFGTRRTGFVPASPLGDEPPVTNSNYFTNKIHTNIFEVAAEATAAAKRAQAAKSNDTFRQQSNDGFLDARQSSPYASHVGEKTDPFDGASFNRARSVRDAFRNLHESRAAEKQQTPPRPRSVSVGDASPSPRPKSSEAGGNKPQGKLDAPPKLGCWHEGQAVRRRSQICPIDSRFHRSTEFKLNY